LPSRPGQQGVDRPSEAAVVVTDDELYATKATLDELGQDDAPGGLVLAREGVEAEDLALALAVHRRGQNDGDA
jgi:hypothetical protein